MTVYRRPDPIPLPRTAPTESGTVAPARADNEDLNHIAARQIFLAITSGRVGRHGTLPNEHELGHDLGVSRTVVREAIKGLASKSVVETRRRRGTVVLERTHWNMLDTDIIGWLRRGGSSEAISQALWQSVALTQGPLAGLAALSPHRKSVAHAAAELGQASLNVDAIAQKGVAFHMAVAAAASNDFLATLTAKCLEGLLQDDHRFLVSMLTRRSKAQYAVLADALHNGDALSAQSLMTRLFEDAMTLQPNEAE